MLRHLSYAAPKRVLIVGRGFIGGALADRCLREGWDHVVFGRPATAGPDYDGLLVDDEGRPLEAVAQPDDTAVILAARTPDRDRTRGGPDARSTLANISLASRIAAGLRAVKHHAIYISSDAVYAPTALPITEETPAAPGDLYGAAHRTRELIMARELSAPIAVLRPCAVYGNGDTHNAYGPNRFVRQALKNEGIDLIGDGDDRRDHIYIGDVIDIIARVIERRSEGVLNLATGSAFSFREIAEFVVAMSRRSVDILHNDRPVGAVATSREFDITALRAAFSYVPTKLLTGIAEMMKRARVPIDA